MNERDRILEKLSPDELLMYVARGGKLVTRLAQLHYAKALAGLSIQYVPTPADLTRLLAERNPQGIAKPQRPLVYRPDRGKRRPHAGKAQVQDHSQRRKTA